jgi:hypothetical protein
MEEKNLELYERLLNSSEGSPWQKEMLKLMVCEKERRIQTCKKWIKHLTAPPA